MQYLTPINVEDLSYIDDLSPRANADNVLVTNFWALKKKKKKVGFALTEMIINYDRKYCEHYTTCFQRHTK